MGCSSHPATVTMPNTGGSFPSVLEFLCHRFPSIPRPEWLRRISAGKVLDEEGRPITPDAPCVPGKRLYYFRENPDEPIIPFAEEILFRDQHLLVADKPHFLPVVPAGPFVEECLLARLRRATGLAELAPLHRIDRETAGLVLFSVDRTTRGPYADLFRTGAVEKEYEAVSDSLPPGGPGGPGGPWGEFRWEVADRLVRGEPFFRMKRVAGAVNARTIIELAGVGEGRSRFSLRPLTGKKHQLRVHLASLGFPVQNDRLYPALLPKGSDDFTAPLQLLARRVRFCDPLNGAAREFFSRRSLP